MLVLGIETSCDETAVSILKDGQEIIANVVSSQYLHSRFGGVVPEIAARAHIQHIVPITQTAKEIAKCDYKEIDLICATYGPGLIGALLVGLSFAKSLAFALKKPFVGVNHLEGHIFAIFLSYENIPTPFLALIISGGHTDLYLVRKKGDYQSLGTTLDDACGEAFDKAAKMLGYPYPGGHFIEKLAREGERRIKFPMPKISGYDFSFSGLKTAVLYYLRDHKDYNVNDVACSFQEVVIDFLWEKIKKAAFDTGVKNIAITGGVAANQRLSFRLRELGERYGFKIFIPPIHLCTDNAAMIAACGYFRYLQFGPSSLDLEASAVAFL